MGNIFIAIFWAVLFTLLFLSWIDRSGDSSKKYVIWWKNNLPVFTEQKLLEEKSKLEKLKEEGGLCEESAEVYRLIVQELERRQKN